MVSKLRPVNSRRFNPAVFAGLMVLLTLPSGAFGIDKPEPPDRGAVQMVGVISPDGKAHLWATSISASGELLGLLNRHPSKIIDEIRYYQPASWKETAGVLTALNQHQVRVIRQLVQDVQKLKERISRLEKRGRRAVHSGSMNYRLKRLEEKVDNMSDGGNP